MRGNNSLQIGAVKIPITLDSQIYERLLTILTPIRKERILHFRRFEDKYRSLFAEILVRTMICRTTGMLNSTIQFINSKSGKPFLKSDSIRIDFNVSHSGDWVVAAIANGCVGIDIEELKPIDHSAIVRRFFSKEEAAFLNGIKQEGQLQNFYTFWTMKESFLKLIGKGILIPLNRVIIQKTLENGYSTVYEGERYYFKQYDIDENYILSYCTVNKDHPNQVNIFSQDELLDQF